MQRWLIACMRRQKDPESIGRRRMQIICLVSGPSAASDCRRVDIAAVQSEAFMPQRQTPEKQCSMSQQSRPRRHAVARPNRLPRGTAGMLALNAMEEGTKCSWG